MDLGDPGWLSELLERILAGYDEARALTRLPEESRGAGSAAAIPAVNRARLHLERELRRSGLIYGSPKLPGRVTQGRRLDRSDALFLAVLSGECFLALDVARILGIPFDRQRTEVELTMFLAAAAGEPGLAERLRVRGLGKTVGPFNRLQAEVGEILLGRLPLVTGDSAFDLPLHNGIVFGEARMVGRLAVEWYARGQFRPEQAARLHRAAGRERAALLEALLALSMLHHPPTDAGRRAVKRELRKLSLPRAQASAVRAAIDTPPSPAALAGKIRSRGLRHFVLEQVHLGAIVDGKIDDAEGRFLRELAVVFGATEAQIQGIEAQVADYFYDPDDVLDAFEVLAAGQSASEAVVDRIARELLLNLDRIALELRETGELTQLLAAAARGTRLTPEQRARARAQLIDVAKVVPSLAIIAAPGGMLIFAALLKVLPFSILPSSFQGKTPVTPVGERPPRALEVLRRSRR